MAPPIKHNLADFRKWLEEERRMAPMGSRGYAGAVSAILSKLEADHSQEAVDRLFSSLSEKSSYGNYLTAWRAYTQYKKSIGFSLPEPRSRRLESSLAPLPPEAISLATALRASGLPAASLNKLCWRHCRPAGNLYRVEDPQRREVVVEVAAMLVEAWRRVTVCDEGLPLFPVEPGVDRPYPLSKLTEQIRNVFLSEDASLPVETAQEEEGPSIAALRAAWVQENGEVEEECPVLVPALPAPSNLSTADLASLLKGPTVPEKRCQLCQQDYKWHAESWELMDGTLAGCAREEDTDRKKCPRCTGNCPGRHYFVGFVPGKSTPS